MKICKNSENCIDRVDKTLKTVLNSLQPVKVHNKNFGKIIFLDKTKKTWPNSQVQIPIDVQTHQNFSRKKSGSRQQEKSRTRHRETRVNREPPPKPPTMDATTTSPGSLDETLRSTGKSGGLVCGNSQGTECASIGQRANGTHSPGTQVCYKSTSVLGLRSKNNNGEGEGEEVDLEVFKQNFGAKQMFVLTENNKLGQWFQVSICQLPGTERVVFEINALFGQVEQGRSVFVRALAEQLFHLEPGTQFIISINLREEFLTKANLGKIVESLK